jgi:hypothetical protein
VNTSGICPPTYVAHRLAAALVGHVREREAGALREQLAREVRRAAGARRSIRKLLLEAQKLS